MSVKYRNTNNGDVIEREERDAWFENLANWETVSDELTEVQPTYPFLDGEVLVLGPEVFIDADREVITYQGRNFYAGAAPTETESADAGAGDVPADADVQTAAPVDGLDATPAETPSETPAAPTKPARRSRRTND